MLSDREISGVKKCVFSGTVIKIKVKENTTCGDLLTLYIKGYENVFYVDVAESNGKCDFGLSVFLYGRNKSIPKKGDKVDFLIAKGANLEPTILSDKKVGEGVYTLISGTELKGDFEICKPNYHLIIGNVGIRTENIKYIKMGSLILGIIILLIVIIILFRKCFKNS